APAAPPEPRADAAAHQPGADASRPPTATAASAPTAASASASAREVRRARMPEGPHAEGPEPPERSPDLRAGLHRQGRYAVEAHRRAPVGGLQPSTCGTKHARRRAS